MKRLKSTTNRTLELADFRPAATHFQYFRASVFAIPPPALIITIVIMEYNVQSEAPPYVCRVISLDVCRQLAQILLLH